MNSFIRRHIHSRLLLLIPILIFSGAAGLLIYVYAGKKPGGIAAVTQYLVLPPASAHPIVLEAPPRSGQIYIPRGATIQFQCSWWLDKIRAGRSLASRDPRPLFLEISEDPHFTDDKTRHLSLPAVQDDPIPIPMAEGHYFWRVRDNKEPLSEVWAFTIIEERPLKPLPPSLVARAGGETSVTFRWKAPAFNHGVVVKHRLQLARDAGFSNPLPPVTLPATEGETSVAALPPGRLYWRYASTYPGGGTVVSKSETLLIPSISTARASVAKRNRVPASNR